MPLQLVASNYLESPRAGDWASVQHWRERWCSGCYKAVRDINDLDIERRLCPACQVRPDMVFTTEGHWRERRRCRACHGCGAWFFPIFSPGPGGIPAARCDGCWKIGRRALREMLRDNAHIYGCLHSNRLLAEDVAHMSDGDRRRIYGLGEGAVQRLSALIPYQAPMVSGDDVLSELRELGVVPA